MKIKLCRHIECDKGKKLKGDTTEVINCPHCRGKGYTIETKEDYVCVMHKLSNHWYWYIRTYNGHTISTSHSVYSNRSQCRNIGKKFADKMGIEWREE